ncbi:hypothetical protein GEV33_002617 [Tenebrio molitor]|jgi:hypothetical protein|uniref:Secreted protein n=1 Tax=Tenebrio molitor TaxID=7067 RepID=A0A8J6HV80_TENMO|nr:hypothetical protein GEV33_002617 [Tenebrio molitor]
MPAILIYFLWLVLESSLILLRGGGAPGAAPSLGTNVALCSGLSGFHSLSVVSSLSSNCDFHWLASVRAPPLVTCWLTFSSSMTANCVKLWSLRPERELLAADGCRLLGLSCSGVAGDSTRLPPPCTWAGVTTRNRPRVATPDWLFLNGAGFWLASDVDFAEATASLSRRSGGCSRWDVARRRGAAKK